MYRLPFLGVHFTPRMNGEVWLGPNAVLGMKSGPHFFYLITFLECRLGCCTYITLYKDCELLAFKIFLMLPCSF
jgi:2-hydroxyglutarate dehydrogenase